MGRPKSQRLFKLQFIQTRISIAKNLTKVTCIDDEKRPEPEVCKLEVAKGQCQEIGDQCNMKATAYSDGTNEGSKATVVCRQHYRMNLPYEKDSYVYGQKSTFAYCHCTEGNCTWKFNKGQVQCTYCPAEQLQVGFQSKLMCSRI